ncbi:MAG: folylpolyglutamate synthase/dihydrofolate synthase family protein [Anaerolineales bacterium]|jgi:dihydrofolate synthase/folylpolyglutamate synthase
MNDEAAYNHALDYLYSYIDYSLKKSSELAKAHFELGRMRALMDYLGNPQETYPIIHVAGTKGKGSTSAMMAAVLTTAGYRTGLYTSPHLQDYTERIQIDGQPIAHSRLVELVEEIKPAVAKIPALTTFEITTALGLLHFARQNVNAAVIEVGLGGRLDATNVVIPRVAVITSLSYDHMAVLGNTLTLIAGEKAGIIKPGIPVVSSPQRDEALAVLEKVSVEQNAALTLVGRDVTFEPLEHSLNGQSFSLVDRQLKTANPVILRIPLLGTHQMANAATAYAALRASGLNLSEESMQRGFASVRWPCRFDIVRREPPIVLDSAHNIDSARRLRETLDDYFPGRPIVWVFSILEDKDAQGMLVELKPRITQVIATQTDHPRVLEAQKIIDLVQPTGIPVEVVRPASAALERAIELAGARGVVLVAGSVAFAGEMKTAWEKRITNNGL